MICVDVNNQRPQLTHDMELGKHISHTICWLMWMFT